MKKCNNVITPDGKFIKEYMENVADVISPDKKGNISKTNLSHQTIARIDKLGKFTEKDLTSKACNFKFYSLVIAESIDATDQVQFPIFTRGINDEYKYN